MKTFAQWVIALTRGYIKATGKKPDKLAKLKINMEAGQKVRDQEKILTPDFGKNKPWYKVGSKSQIKIDTSDLKHPELAAGIMRATKQKPTLATTKGISDKAFKDQHLSFRLNIAKNSREFNQDLAKQIINREIYKDFSDVQRKQFLDDLTSVLKEPLAGGGVAGMLGEPTYQDDNHRVPLSGGGGLMKVLQMFFKKKPNTLKEFIERRQFIKNMVGNTPENEKARVLAELKKATDEVRKNPPFKFPDTEEIKKEVWKELTKGITKHADGGVAGMLGE
jgi:hypothetical protein